MVKLTSISCSKKYNLGDTYSAHQRLHRHKALIIGINYEFVKCTERDNTLMDFDALKRG